MLHNSVAGGELTSRVAISRATRPLPEVVGARRREYIQVQACLARNRLGVVHDIGRHADHGSRSALESLVADMQDRASLERQRLAGGRQADAAGRAFQQRDADLALER